MSILTHDPLLDIRLQFPIFANRHNGKPLIYFDSAASSQKPMRVIQAVSHFYQNHYANIHRGLYDLSVEATQKYEDSRAAMAQFFGVNRSGQIIFTKGATESLNLLAFTLGEKFVKENDNIVITDLEHHANLVPWQQLALRKKATLHYVPLSQLNSMAEVNEEWLSKYLPEKITIFSFTGMSNALGSQPPIHLLAHAAKKRGAVVVLDAAQLACHAPLSLSDLPVDFAVMAGHKMLGPTGIGILYGKRELLSELPPYQMGGDMIKEVGLYDTTWAGIPERFEAGTPPIAEAIGLHEAIRFLSEIGMDNIQAHEKKITEYAIEQLTQIQGLQIYGEPGIKHRGGVISFSIENIHPFDLATLLTEENIALRIGHHCCQVLMKQLGIKATIRISFYLYNTIEEVDIFIRALEKARRMFL